MNLASDPAANAIPATANDWQYGYGKYDETAQRVTDFTKLPHFTGNAWQGGTAYPDAALGWAQLTAAGGHPGNDLDHAVIRRWVAPREMTVEVRSELIHEPPQGKGVRAFVVSNRHGLLKQASVHKSQAELNTEAFEVKAGDTLDFLVDRGELLSYNQFLWKATVAASKDANTNWDSQRDFQQQPAQQLGPWEQLAQVLLSANEFVFVD